VASVERRTSNPPSQVATARQASNATVFEIRRWALDVERYIQPIAWLAPTGLADRILCLTRLKMLQLKACHVWQSYCILYVHTDSHAITCC
jgi:hypothetical protein